jgi:ATP-dependent Clp protease protease subunit
LKGLPASITTHNFGSVDSIGIVLYCAGSQRLSVPQARFLFHGVNVQFRGEQNLDEKLLEERLKGLRIDMENIAKVISANTGKSAKDVTDAMIERITLNPEEAQPWGLVHEIKSKLFEEGSEVIAIQFQQQPQQLPKPPR